MSLIPQIVATLLIFSPGIALAEDWRTIKKGERDGATAAEIGCLANALFSPENGGCLEKPLNKQRYDTVRRQIQENTGGGVLQPVDNPLDFETEYEEAEGPENEDVISAPSMDPLASGKGKFRKAPKCAFIDGARLPNC